MQGISLSVSLKTFQHTERFLQGLMQYHLDLCMWISILLYYPGKIATL